MLTIPTGPLTDVIAEASARLETIRAEMRETPMYQRESRAFLSKAAERQTLLAKLEALRRLVQLEK